MSRSIAKGTTFDCTLPISGCTSLGAFTSHWAGSNVSGLTRLALRSSQQSRRRHPGPLSGRVQSVRETLRSILATYPDFQVVGEACNGEEALESVQVLKPSVVVMDINMPQLDGIKATSLIKRVYPHVVIVGLSVYANDDTRKAMTAAGATTVISKEVAVEQLRDEIIESINKRSASFH